MFRDRRKLREIVEFVVKGSGRGDGGELRESITARLFLQGERGELRESVGGGRLGGRDRGKLRESVAAGVLLLGGRRRGEGWKLWEIVG